MSSRHWWTEEELAWMAEHVPGTLRAECIAAFAERFGWTPTVAQWNHACVKYGFKAGRNAAWYEKGREPETKGRHWDDYMSKESQERVLNGSALNKSRPMYSVRRKGKNATIKVPDDICRLFGRKPLDGKRYGFVRYNRYTWYEMTGHVPLPDEYIVHIDGDDTNDEAGNLDLVSRNVFHVLQSRGWTKETYKACKARAILEDAMRLYGHICPACRKHFVSEFRDQQYCRECIDDGTQRRMTQKKIAESRWRKHDAAPNGCG